MNAATVPVDFDPFAHGELVCTAPSTEEQREIWTAIELGGPAASCAFNQAVSLRIAGPLDVAALDRALARIVGRHEALRTNVTPDGATLVVRDARLAPLAVEDVSGSPMAALQSARQEAVTTPFDLVREPLIRARLFKTGADTHELIVTAHHIVCDGWSTRVMVPELAALYGEEALGQPADLPQPFSFSRYAALERQVAQSQKGSEDEEYWVQLHAADPSALDLPTDRPRPSERTFEAESEFLRLPPECVRGLREVGNRVGASLVATVLAAFEVFLHRITGQESFAVGMPSAGQRLAGAPSLVGHCVHTLPLRAEVNPERSFLAHLEAVRRHLLEASEHPHFTFGTLLSRLSVPRDASRVPLVPVLFNLDPGYHELSFPGGIDVEYRAIPRRFESFELYFDASVDREAIDIELTYSARLFSPDGMRRRLAQFARLLDSILEDPEQAVAALVLLPEAERRLLCEWGCAAGPEPPAGDLASLVERQVERAPDAVAVQDALGSVTYAELDARANQVARRLAAIGVLGGDRVGVLVQRDALLLEALLGVLKAGATYVPLNPTHPEARLRLIAERSRLSALVTEDRIVGGYRPAGRSVLLLDADAAAIRAEPTSRPERSADSARLAYVTFTSGSTGTPKGVEVSHRAVVNFLTSMARRPGLTPDDVLVAVTTVAFDISVLELFLPLTVGARVFVVDSDAATDGRRLGMILDRIGATVFQATPATYRLLVEGGWCGRPGFKALVGGEALSPGLARELRARGLSVFNMYGPTETTVWSTCHEVESVDGPVPIGRPIDWTDCWVLDASRSLVPVGVSGELYIGGRGVARGYFDEPELTRQHFVENPFDGSARLYRTGDRVRWTDEGLLSFEGRLGGFVKLRGYRIELGEVEARLASEPGVRDVVAVLRHDAGSEPALCAYVVAHGDVTAPQLHRAVAEQLPSYMVPQYITIIDSIPRTPNNKIDRQALPPPATAVQQDEAVLPRTETEHTLALIWAELLGLDRVSVHWDFFMLGGHSMLATRMLERVREATGVELGLRLLFRAPTIAALAEHVDAVRLTGDAVEGDDREELVL